MNEKPVRSDGPIDSSSIGSRDEASSDFPSAEVLSGGVLRRYGSRLWLWTAASLLFSVIAFVAFRSDSGLRIVVEFASGHGIDVGASLQYRGVSIGRVVRVSLSAELSGVEVEVALSPDGESVAVAGSLFWVERPIVGVGRVSGLETVVGAKYLGVVPGEASGSRQTRFVGLENPIVLGEPASVDVSVRFDHGQRVQAGDPVLFRGIRIGEVISVSIEGDLRHVLVRARIVSGGGRVAREGTQFWIARPEIGWDGVRGIDALARRHLAVIPGPPEGPERLSFVGLEREPSAAAHRGGLEILLESLGKEPVSPGVPVTYRGVMVGAVRSAGLSGDSASVDLRVVIQPAFQHLVRANTVFWVSSGVDVSIGWLSGFELYADSLAAMAKGGLAFATPEPPGPSVSTGHRFVLSTRPDDWERWTPRLPVGTSLLPDGTPTPRPLRAVARWRERTVGFVHEERREGWVLRLEDGSIVGPRDILEVPPDAFDSRSIVELGGERVRGSVLSSESTALVLRCRAGDSSGGSVPGPVDSADSAEGARTDDARIALRVRSATAPEEGLVVGDPGRPPIPLAASRLRPRPDGLWALDAAVPLGEAWHGAVLLSRKDGMIIGMVVASGGSVRVAPVPTWENRGRLEPADPSLGKDADNE